jgi:hypothetical protein
MTLMEAQMLRTRSIGKDAGDRVRATFGLLGALIQVFARVPRATDAVEQDRSTSAR